MNVSCGDIVIPIGQIDCLDLGGRFSSSHSRFRGLCSRGNLFGTSLRASTGVGVLLGLFERYTTKRMISTLTGAVTVALAGTAGDCTRAALT